MSSEFVDDDNNDDAVVGYTEKPTHSERYLYSDIVRQLHDRLQTQLSADPELAANDAGSDEVIAQWKKVWGTIPSEDAKQYAHAMDKLFHKCWEGTNYVVDVLEQWFSHPVKQPRDTVCGEGACKLKATRVEYFKCHGVVMPPEDVARVAREINQAMLTEVIHVLDVGSCHGGLLAAAPQWMRVAAVDLCPAKPEVLQGDWLSVHLGESEVDSAVSHSPYTVDVQTNRLLAVKCDSMDVVVMCYMLSFLPSGLLRWEGVKRAMKVLRCGGLLLIMEPRRGAHHNQWHKKWTRVLSSNLRCDVLRTELMVHTVSLLLRKPLGWSEGSVGSAASLDFS